MHQSRLGSAFRAYGSPQAFLASESLVDELAEKLGMDPLEFRYINVYRPGSTTPTGQDPEVYSLPEMLDKLRPLYKEAKDKAARESTPEHMKGWALRSASMAAAWMVWMVPKPRWS